MATSTIKAPKIVTGYNADRLKIEAYYDGAYAYQLISNTGAFLQFYIYSGEFVIESKDASGNIVWSKRLPLS